MAWIEQQYDLWRGLHIIAVIAWMAGMMYLPRLFAYHADAASGGELDTTFKTMEVKLLRIIINPAMVLTFVFGTLLICADGVRRGWGFLLEPWMLTKIAGIIFLASWHGFLAGSRKRFEAGTQAGRGTCGDCLARRRQRRMGAGSVGLVERRRVCREAEGCPRCPRVRGCLAA